MITTAFLLKVIIYGLIAAIIIPAIDFVLFLFREGRRSSPSFEIDLDAGEWRSKRGEPSPYVERHAPQRRRSPSEPASPRHSSSIDASSTGGRTYARSTGERTYAPSTGAPSGAPSTGGRTHAPSNDGYGASHAAAASRRPETTGIPRYVASNGVTITPNVSAARPTIGGPSKVAPRGSASSHPHAEYWYYGNAMNYDTI